MGEGNLVKASKENRQFSMFQQQQFVLLSFSHDGRLISLKLQQRANLINILTFCFVQVLCNHKYIVFMYVYTCGCEVQLIDAAWETSPYLLKNVNYEWMSMTEFYWAEKHG